MEADLISIKFMILYDFKMLIIKKCGSSKNYISRKNELT